MKKCMLILITVSLFISCGKKDKNGSDLAGPVLILNEGGFNKGEAEITIYDPKSGEVSQNGFLSRNNRPLGDILNSAVKINDEIYLVVNNSKKIEVVEPKTLASIRTLTLPGHISPRYLTHTTGQTGYVSSLFTEYVYKLNLQSGAVEDSLHVGAGSEGLLYLDEKLYVARNYAIGPPFSATTGVAVFDLTNNTHLTTIETLPGPYILLFQNTRLWVGCTGDYEENNGGVVHINTSTHEVVESIELGANLSGMVLHSGRGELYILANGISVMNTNNTSSRNKIITQDYYGIGIDEENNFVYGLDARNFIQNGLLVQYTLSGSRIKDISTGIIPKSIFIND